MISCIEIGLFLYEKKPNPGLGELYPTLCPGARARTWAPSRWPVRSARAAFFCAIGSDRMAQGIFGSFRVRIYYLLTRRVPFRIRLPTRRRSFGPEKLQSVRIPSVSPKDISPPISRISQDSTRSCSSTIGDASHAGDRTVQSLPRPSRSRCDFSPLHGNEPFRLPAYPTEQTRRRRASALSITNAIRQRKA